MLLLVVHTDIGVGRTGGRGCVNDWPAETDEKLPVGRLNALVALWQLGQIKVLVLGQLELTLRFDGRLHARLSGLVAQHKVA